MPKRARFRLPAVILAALLLLSQAGAAQDGENPDHPRGVPAAAAGDPPARPDKAAPGRIPPAGAFGAPAHTDETGNRHLPMGRRAKAVLPSHGDEFLFLYEEGGAAIGLRAEGAAHAPVAGELSAALATYAQVWPDTDVAMQVTEQGYKDTLVITTPPDRNTWTYELVLAGLEPAWADGILRFRTRDGEARFRLGDLTARDARGNETDVLASLRAVAGTLFLDVTVSGSWLREAAYPIAVDPSVLVEGAAPAAGTVVSAVRETGGALNALTTANGNWPFTSTDAGATWIQSIPAGAAPLSAQALAVGSRTYLFYTSYRDGAYGIYARYQEGGSTNWSDPELTAASGLTALPTFSAAVSGSRLMLLYLSGSSLQASISTDAGATWLAATLPTAAYSGTPTVVGMQYFQSQYVAVAQWRSGNDPTYTCSSWTYNSSTNSYDCSSYYWTTGTSITTTAAQFTSTDLLAWNASTIFQESTAASPAGSSYQHPSRASALLAVGSRLVFAESHYKTIQCGGTTTGYTYYESFFNPATGQQETRIICGSLSENNTRIQNLRILAGDMTWTATYLPNPDVSANSLVAGTDGNTVFYQGTVIRSFNLTTLQWSNDYTLTGGSGWMLAGPVVGRRLLAARRSDTSANTLSLKDSAPDTTPPWMTLALGSTVVSNTLMITTNGTDDHSLGPMGLVIDGGTPSWVVYMKQFGLSVSHLAPGTHTIGIIPQDWNGNQGGSPTYEFTIDRTPPTGDLTAPSGSVAAYPITFAATAADNTGVSSVSFATSGSSTRNAAFNASTGLWTAEAPPYLTGDRTISATVRDLAGNSYTTPARTIGFASAASPDYTYYGGIYSATDRRYFAVTPGPSGLALALTVPTGVTYQIDLVDANNTVLATGSGSGTTVVVRHPHRPGSLFARVSGVNGSYSTSSSFTFRYGQADALEPNDTLATATAITETYAAADLTLDSNSDEDWFRFTASGRLLVELQPPSGRSYLLQILDSQGIARYAAGASAGAKVSLSADLVSGNEYYIKVYRLSGNASSNPYALTLSRYPRGSLAPAAGASAGPGGSLSLSASTQYAASWSELQWQRVGDTTWASSNAGAGAITGNTFTTTWTVPTLPGEYRVRAQLATASGLTGYTGELALILPEPVFTQLADNKAGGLLLTWSGGGAGATYDVAYSPDPTFPGTQTEDLVLQTTATRLETGFNGAANASFEITDGEVARSWSAADGTRFSTDSTRSYTGRRSLLYTNARAWERPEQVIYEGTELAGRTVNAAAQVWLEPYTSTFVAELQFYDRRGGIFTPCRESLQGPTAGWTALAVSCPAPAGTDRAVLRFYFESGSANDKAWVDAVQVQAGVSPPPGFSPGLSSTRGYFRLRAQNGVLYNDAVRFAALSLFPRAQGTWAWDR